MRYVCQVCPCVYVSGMKAICAHLNTQGFIACCALSNEPQKPCKSSCQEGTRRSGWCCVEAAVHTQQLHLTSTCEGAQFGYMTVHSLAVWRCKHWTSVLFRHITAAIMSMQRCGVDVVVLEARDRVGGRVHTLTGQGFSAGVDLGASIITGVAANTERAQRSDPSALIAKYTPHLCYINACVRNLLCRQH